MLDQRFRREQEAFQRNFKRLLRRYPNQYVALANGRVIDHGPDDEELAARLFARRGQNYLAIFPVRKTPVVYDLTSFDVVE